MKKISTTSRLIIAIASLLMIGSYFFPLWVIELWAPQYPEGLALNIWHNKLGGDVDIINGLNHYIGMAHLKQESFPEFGILPYLIAFFILLGLGVSIIGQRRFLIGYVTLALTAGVLALIDFYRWGYEYGHNLDPNAAIKVPGMSYQPPVLGYKQLLNFGAYSVPDIGGWIFIFAAFIIALVTFYEYYLCADCRKPKQSSNVALAVTLWGLMSLFISSCSVETEPIQYGKDGCNFCKMTIMEPRFSCELVTQKGKIYKFDDLLCMVKYMKTAKTLDNEYKFMVVNDYNATGQFLNCNEAFFVKKEAIKSPMRGDVAAFSSQEAAKNVDDNVVNWSAIFAQF